MSPVSPVPAQAFTRQPTAGAGKCLLVNNSTQRHLYILQGLCIPSLAKAAYRRPSPHLPGSGYVPKTTWLSRSPTAIWQPSQSLKHFPAAAGPADGRPGPSSQCQPADRRVRTSGWKFVRACPLPGHSLMGMGKLGGGGAGRQQRTQPCSTQNSSWQGLSILPHSQPSQTAFLSYSLCCLSGSSSLCLSLWEPSPLPPWGSLLLLLASPLLAAHSLLGLSAGSFWVRTVGLAS